MFFPAKHRVTPALIPPPVAKTYLAMGSGVMVSPAAPWVAAIMAWEPMAEFRSRW
jgi:hypothetical protein